jgi:thiamine pyrophosphate-dependent acetolactate synthase large subunit-like protein
MMTVARLDQPTITIERPAQPEWGSDVAAEMLRRLGIEFAALNPGASFRGLHDSLVNYNANSMPGMILCNHEEVAVSLAHGYAKYSDRAMAAIVHSNVGLLHATMAIFNAWADRTPVYVLGATGPMDSTLRRPWIDWVHTCNGQGQVVRDYTKWETQPAGVAAIPEAMLRAWHAAHSEPCGPVYVCLDAGLQEQYLDPSRPLSLPDASRYPLPSVIEPSREAVQQAARWVAEAQFPVILLGRNSPGEAAWNDLVALAEALGAAVLTDPKSPASFPTSHFLHQAGLTGRADKDFAAVIQQADVILALDRIDLAGTLKMAAPTESTDGRGGGAAALQTARLIDVSMEPFALRSWCADHQELPAADLPITANPGRAVAALLEAVGKCLADDPAAQRRAEARLQAHRERRERLEAAWADAVRQRWDQTPMSITRAVGELRAALGERYGQAVLAHTPLTWTTGVWDFERPGSYLGAEGGAGVGAGPGITVGVGLAARDSGRTVIGFLGDGNLLMAPTALWTAAHHQIPVLIVVANNRSYFNDEEHQERVARTRSRPVENRWLGQRLDDPPIDFAALAQAQGVEGFGPVDDPADLPDAYARALAAVGEGRPALVDVRISSG